MVFAMGVEAAVQYLVLEYGLIGVLIASLVANASLFFVVPIDLLVFTIAPLGQQYFHPAAIALAAGVGAAIGELTGYIVGLGGRKALKEEHFEQFDRLKKVKSDLKHKGVIVVFLGAFTPFPFDFIGIVAGLMHYDLKRFFAATFAGKFLRYLLLAYAGIIGAEFLLKFFALN